MKEVTIIVCLITIGTVLAGLPDEYHDAMDAKRLAEIHAHNAAYGGPVNEQGRNETKILRTSGKWGN